MKKDSILRNTLVLTLLTLILGTILGFVQHITAEPIAEQDRLKKEEANKAVFSVAETFEEADLEATGLGAKLDEALKAAGLDGQRIEGVSVAKDASGNVLGYVLTVASKGYGGDIEFVTGISNEGLMNGVSYLSISETAGLGMRATSEDFMKQFSEKQVDQFELTKCRAMTNGANAALKAFQVILEEGGV